MIWNLCIITEGLRSYKMKFMTHKQLHWQLRRSIHDWHTMTTNPSKKLDKSTNRCTRSHSNAKNWKLPLEKQYKAISQNQLRQLYTDQYIPITCITSFIFEAYHKIYVMGEYSYIIKSKAMKFALLIKHHIHHHLHHYLHLSF